MKTTLLILSLLSLAACRPAENEETSIPNPDEVSLSDTLEIIQSLGRVESTVAQIKGSDGALSDPLTERLRKALVDAECDITYVRLGQPPTREVHLEVSGEECPVTAKYDLSSKTPQAAKGQVHLNAQYRIHDMNLCLNNDICEMTVVGLGEYERSESNYTLRMSVRANATSNRQGPVGFQATHNLKATYTDPQNYARTGTQVIRFSRSGSILAMNALLRKTLASDTSTYFIDGAAVTQDVYVETLEPLETLLGF